MPAWLVRTGSSGQPFVRFEETMRRRAFLGTTAAVAAAFFAERTMGNGSKATAKPKHFEFELTDEQWRARLTPEQYDVLRQQGTEMAWSSPLEKEERAGTYVCAGCQLA